MKPKFLCITAGLSLITATALSDTITLPPGTVVTLTQGGVVTTPSTSPPTPNPISTDGTVLQDGAAGSLVTALGTWSFGDLISPGLWHILLNGVHAGGGSKMEVANGGLLYAIGSDDKWWIITGLNQWTRAGDPNAPPVPPPTPGPGGALVLKGSYTTPAAASELPALRSGAQAFPTQWTWAPAKILNQPRAATPADNLQPKIEQYRDGKLIATWKSFASNDATCTVPSPSQDAPSSDAAYIQQSA